MGRQQPGWVPSLWLPRYQVASSGHLLRIGTCQGAVVAFGGAHVGRLPALSPLSTARTRFIRITAKFLPSSLPHVSSLNCRRMSRQLWLVRLPTHYTALRMARHAGFSVVQDTFASRSQAAASLALWRSTGQLPSNFHVACMGLVPGSQSFNRAELCAVVQACRHANRLGAPVTDIYTDSSFALAEWERLARSQPCHYPDLAWALVSSWRRQYPLHKVKAHLSLEGLEDDALWKSAGNHLADVAAKQAVQDDFPCLHDFTSGIASEWRKQGDSLYLFLQYLLEVFCEEARLKEQLNHMAQPAEHFVEAGDLQGSGCSVAEWQQLTGTPEPWRIPPCDRDWLLASAWPPWFTKAVWRWCQQLEWDTSRPTHKGVLGAAHIELLANFVVVTGFLPPSSMQDRRPGGPHQLPEEVRTVRMLTLSLSGVVRQLEGLTGVSLWPPRCRRTTALRVLGRDETYGVGVRPKFPLPAQTLHVVKQLCQTSSVRVLEEWARRSSPSYFWRDRLLV